MGAAEEAEHLVVERLHADGEPVDAAVAQRAEAAGFAGGGIRLQGDLAVGVHGPAGANGGDHGGNVAGSISDGVPPPKKTEATLRPVVSAANVSISRIKARRQRARSMPSATWLLKSQYGHFDRQNGQWM